VKNLGWIVTFAGTGINLALGILYSWSVISKKIPTEWNWSETSKSWPYSIACLIFAILMVPAGRMQDKMGPSLTAAIGGLLVGAGMILASFTTTPLGFILGFGVLAGAGIGFGYASATPPAVKWFPKKKTGMIAGLVVAGFGLASVYTAPLTQALIGSVGLPTTMQILGGAFLVVVVGLALLLRPPPKGFVAEPAPAPGAAAGPKKEDFGPLEMLKTPQFFLLWILFACGSGAGLMIVGKLTKIAVDQVGIQGGFLFVAILAIGNGGGRILAGTLSDKIGRLPTLGACFVLQSGLIFALSWARPDTVFASLPLLGVHSALIGACYGANLALFPSLTKDYYGLKNFGMNYGLVFTSWGVGGFVLSLVSGKVYDATKEFTLAYYIAAGLLVFAALATLAMRPVKAKEAPAKA
jgi:OFA family oxalate/formate antiporter-like MFS transporter